MAELVEKIYSKALFEISSEENSLEETLKELISLSEIFGENKDIIKILSSPTLNLSEKTKIISDIFENKLSKNIFNFLNVVVEKGRISCIFKIIDCFKELYNEKFGILEVEIITTSSLSENLKEKLIKKLESSSNKKITLIENIDKNILGGIVLNYKNTQLDASLRTKLDTLRYEIDNVIA